MPDDRPYIRVHDGVDEHPKVDGLSDASFRLLVSNWCWCSRNKTDGRIRAATWAKRGSARSRKELLESGLAALLDNGDVEMHDYLEHQRSAAEIEELKAKRRAAGQAGGRASARASARAKPQPGDSKIQPSTEADTELKETSAKPPRIDAEKVCDALVRAMVNNGCKRPVVTEGWRDEARKLIDLDKRPLAEILRVIAWAHGDDFWKKNIHSLPTLRKQYDKLRLAMDGPSKPRVGNGVYDDEEEVWMR